MSNDRSSDYGRATRAATQRLESLHRAGVTHGKRRPEVTTPARDAAPEQPPVAPPQDDGQRDDRTAALAALAREVAACTHCAELARTRTQIVFGTGNPHARLVFLGEAPGADEDRQGEPFVGRAGRLLTDMIEKGMQLRRADVYIMNILRCRPPGNRDPAPAEAAACRQFVNRQLAVIEPEVICCLGGVAAKNLLQTDASIGRLRGRFHDYQGVKVLCTYHPAYLLRNPAAKRSAWDDLQLLMEEMGIAGR